jgi:hypothetical protein
MAPAHTHTHTHTQSKERVRAPDEKGRTDTTFSIFSFSPGVSLTKGSRRRKQTDVPFANPGEEEKIPVARQGNGC